MAPEIEDPEEPGWGQLEVRFCLIAGLIGVSFIRAMQCVHVMQHKVQINLLYMYIRVRVTDIN